MDLVPGMPEWGTGKPITPDEHREMIGFYLDYQCQIQGMMAGVILRFAYGVNDEWAPVERFEELHGLTFAQCLDLTNFYVRHHEAALGGE